MPREGKLLRQAASQTSHGTYDISFATARVNGSLAKSLWPGNWRLNVTPRKVKAGISNSVDPARHSVSNMCSVSVNYHDDIYGPEVHEVGPHVVSCMLYIQVIVKA